MWRIPLVTASILAASLLVPATTSAATAPPTCLGRPATIVVPAAGRVTWGTPGPDVIVGTSGPDVIHGDGGGDIICGGDGNDQLFKDGGRMPATLVAGLGNNLLNVSDGQPGDALPDCKETDQAYWDNGDRVSNQCG